MSNRKSRHEDGVAYRSSCLNGDLGHTNVRLVEVLDCLGRIVRGLVADVANTSLRNQLDIGNLATLGGEVLPELGLGDVGWQTLDEDP